MSIASFEQDIQGVRNFVDLALGSPYTNAPTVMLVSSVGVFISKSILLMSSRKLEVSHLRSLVDCKIAPPIPEIPLDDPSSPFGAGYGEGKWVAEHVLQNVTERRGVHTVVMRLGQVAGDRKGYWNEREWFPSLVKSALFQKCLPEHDGVRGLSICIAIWLGILTLTETPAESDVVPCVRGCQGVYRDASLTRAHRPPRSPPPGVLAFSPRTDREGAQRAPRAIHPMAVGTREQRRAGQFAGSRSDAAQPCTSSPDLLQGTERGDDTRQGGDGSRVHLDRQGGPGV